MSFFDSLKTGFGFFNSGLGLNTPPPPPAGALIDEELGIPSESVFNRMKLHPFSPDALLQRKGWKILERMAQDDQIAQNLTALKVMRLSTGFTIEAADDTPAAEEHKEFIEFLLTDFIEGSINQDLFEIMGALGLGYSITEKNYKIIEKGRFKGKIGLKNLKSKRPHDFNIFTDEFLNPISLVKVEQPDIGNELPIDKFIIYSFRKRYENVFGTALTRSLYDLWWLKHIVKRSLGVYLERFGVPFAIGTYEDGFKQKAAAFRMLKALRTETVALLPKSLDVEFKETTGRGVDLFIKTIKHIDEQISKTILGQTLTQSQGSSGSQSLGKVHQDILTLYINELGNDLEDLLNEQLIRDLIDFNFPNVDKYPKYKFKSIDAEDEGPQIDRFLKAKDKGLVIATEEDEAWIREQLNFPERNEDTPLLVNPNTPPMISATPDETDPDDPDNGDDDNPPVGGPSNAPAEPTSKQPKGKVPPSQKAPLSRLAESFSTSRPIFTGVSSRSFTTFEEKVDFKETRRVIEELGVEDTRDALAPILRESADQIVKQIKRKKIISKRDYAAIRDLSISNKGDIKKVFQRSLERTARKGITAARKEIRLSKMVDAAEFNKRAIEQFLVQNSFKMTGDLTDAMRIAASNSLFNAIKNGASEKEAIDGIFKALEPFFRTGASTAEDFAGGRLSTILRTNTTGAYNFARREFFLEDTETTPAMQYSAVLDDRLRPNHEKMHAKIFRSTNAIWDIWTPANGFNCRCLLIPITKFDDWNGIESRVPSAEPDRGFGKV